MRRFVWLFVLIPLAIVLVVLSVANRQAVTLSLDPFGVAPGLSMSAPFFVFLFAAVALGILVGGVAAWLRQGHWRREARRERAEVERVRREADQLRARGTATTPALPVTRDAA